MRFDLNEHPHRRYNPLTDEWVLVSPHRAKRPWQGQLENDATEPLPRYDPHCYLCPGNTRANGQQNPDYSDVFVFDNDFAALLPDTPAGHYQPQQAGLLRAEAEQGICRVICFAPRHDLTLAEMDSSGIQRVVEVWTAQYRELGALQTINHVQIFENKGAAMGCSNPHPHGQIWAQASIPNAIAQEQRQMQHYWQQHGQTLLGAYLQQELRLGERIICANEGFVALVPFWAVWPFEVLILCRRTVASLLQLDDHERALLADMIKHITVRYDNLFQTSFPYSAGLHQAPTDGQAHPEWDFHMHFYPPLLRSASVRKFMVGYEMLASPQRDITPETSAGRLRDVSEQHYKTA